MSTVIVGDLHIKARKVLPRIDALIERREDIDRIVFTGDYCDDWQCSDAQFMSDIEYLASWVKEKRDDGMEVVLTIGNHDFQYFLGVPGPGTKSALYTFVRDTLFSLEPVMACDVDGYLVTHAGVTGAWAALCLDAEASGIASAASVACDLNKMYEIDDPSVFRLFDMCGVGRGGWSIPSPIWADKRELEMDPVDGINQIVGHTPVWHAHESMAHAAKEKDVELWFCDTFSTYTDGRDIGDGTVIVVEDGKPKVEELPLV